MKSHRNLATYSGAILGTLCAVLFLALQGHAQPREGDLKKEFHQTYPLSADGDVELKNTNGPVHITAWDRNEVKLDAVKSAWTRTRLDEAQIKIDVTANHIFIRTDYPDHEQIFSDDSRDNPATVEYTLMVPRRAHLDEINLINGTLDVRGMAGEVRASCINGRLTARSLTGRVKLSTINGTLDATFDQLPSAPIELSSVNGEVMATLPSDSNADLEAKTISGWIKNDFGLRVVNHRFVGHDLHGQLGGGATRIALRNVNGAVEIRHANDNLALSPAKNLNNDQGRGRDYDDDEI